MFSLTCSFLLFSIGAICEYASMRPLNVNAEGRLGSGYRGGTLKAGKGKDISILRAHNILERNCRLSNTVMNIHQ